MASFKGSVFASSVAFTQQTYGTETVQQVLSDLSREERETLQSSTAVGWIPVEPVLAFVRGVEAMHGGPDHELCERMGHFSAGWSINSVIRVFARLQSPGWLIDKGTSVWSRYHDTGRWEFQPREQGHMSGRLLNYAVVDAGFCARLRGWLVGAAELTGGVNAKVSESRCTSRGHDHCAFTISWDT